MAKFRTPDGNIVEQYDIKVINADKGIRKASRYGGILPKHILLKYGYTEVDEETEEEKEKRYEELVNRYIRQKYSVSQEFAILRQKESKADEYQEYYDYCEECKVKAKSEVND